MKSLIILLCIATHLCGSGKHAIVYTGGSRFGDRMSLYLQARYLSEITGIAFLHRSFLYSNELSVEFDAAPYSLNVWKYKKSFKVNNGAQLLEFFQRLSDADSSLFEFSYTVDNLSEWESFSEGSYLLNYQSDDRFMAKMRSCLIPKIPIPTLTQPGVLNVAAHIRVLSGEDTPDWSFVKFPLRHPNVNYHKGMIEKIYEWNGQGPMHVFLFSDSPRPLELLEDFKAAFQGTNIEFGIRILEKADVDYAVEDFFAMQEFDALISTQSNFSKIASKLGDFDMVIYPIHSKKRGAGETPLPSEIDQVQIISKKSEWFPFTLDFILLEGRR